MLGGAYHRNSEWLIFEAPEWLDRTSSTPLILPVGLVQSGLLPGRALRGGSHTLYSVAVSRTWLFQMPQTQKFHPSQRGILYGKVERES